MTMDFSAERLSYEKGELIESNLPSHPVELLIDWVKTAVDEGVVEPYAMSFATCGEDNLPSVRTLLMREITQPNDSAGKLGIVFYTNYDSNKGDDILQNPNAQTLFFWHSLERQVRISGTVRKVSEKKSTDYFHQRPQDSQIAAWVSEPQSGLVVSREAMELKFDEYKQQFAETSSIPMPKFWGGYELVANKIEFWQGRANRMHDRIRYSVKSDGSWLMERLLP